MTHPEFGAEFLEDATAVRGGDFADASVAGYVYLAWLRATQDRRRLIE